MDCLKQRYLSWAPFKRPRFLGIAEHPISKIRLHWNFLEQSFQFKILNEGTIILSSVLDGKEDGLAEQLEYNVAVMTLAQLRWSWVMQVSQVGSEVWFSSSFRVQEILPITEM